MQITNKNVKGTPTAGEEEQEEMLEWGPPALTNTPLSHAHTASTRPLARTTRTRNETETVFPIGRLLRRLIPVNFRSRDLLPTLCNVWVR